MHNDFPQQTNREFSKPTHPSLIHLHSKLDSWYTLKGKIMMIEGKWSAGDSAIHYIFVEYFVIQVNILVWWFHVHMCSLFTFISDDYLILFRHENVIYEGYV